MITIITKVLQYVVVDPVASWLAQIKFGRKVLNDSPDVQSYYEAQANTKLLADVLPALVVPVVRALKLGQ